MHQRLIRIRLWSRCVGGDKTYQIDLSHNIFYLFTWRSNSFGKTVGFSLIFEPLKFCLSMSDRQSIIMDSYVIN